MCPPHEAPWTQDNEERSTGWKGSSLDVSFYLITLIIHYPDSAEALLSWLAPAIYNVQCPWQPDMTMGTENGTQKVGMPTKWLFTLPTKTAKLKDPTGSFLPSRQEFPEKFIQRSFCYSAAVILKYKFFSISFHIRDPLSLPRLICHRLSGLIFFATPLTVSDFSLDQSICVTDFSFHFLQASPWHQSFPFWQ